MKNILFLTGTRADFGKIKSLLTELDNDGSYNLHVFVTGMHMLQKYGYTCLEVERLGIGKIHKYYNQKVGDSMDEVMASTMQGLSAYLKENEIDLVVVHGDRVEALAGATTAALNNILVAHIEGGEVSGTIDELIRHAVSKMSHIHFVANDEAAKRLVQLGEKQEYIKVIGSPDIDIMLSPDLPAIDEVKKYYKIDFSDFAILMYHPVTTEFDEAFNNAESIVNSVCASQENFVVIYPNNDHGSEEILRAYEAFEGNDKVVVLPSMRFEYFLTLLKNSKYMVGNSSAGVRECPYYGIPTVNIGSRQFKRVVAPSIINCASYSEGEIGAAMKRASEMPHTKPEALFGQGNSSELFLKTLKEMIHDLPDVQKHFVDIDSGSSVEGMQ